MAMCCMASLTASTYTSRSRRSFCPPDVPARCLVLPMPREKEEIFCMSILAMSVVEKLLVFVLLNGSYLIL